MSVFLIQRTDSLGQQHRIHKDRCGDYIYSRIAVDGKYSNTYDDKNAFPIYNNANQALTKFNEVIPC